MSYAKVKEAYDRTLPETHLPCAWCRKPTIKETLANYGARCFQCYEAYCAEDAGVKAGLRDTPQQAEMRKHVKRRNACLAN